MAAAGVMVCLTGFSRASEQHLQPLGEGGRARRLQERQRRGAAQAEAAACGRKRIADPIARLAWGDSGRCSFEAEAWTTGPVGEGLRWDLLREFDPRQANGSAAT